MCTAWACMYYVVSMALGVPGEGVLGVGMPGGGTRARAKRDFSSAVKNINIVYASLTRKNRQVVPVICH
jgi:hypothetical protein